MIFLRELKKSIGLDGDVEVETEAILIENNIDYSEFDEKVRHFLVKKKSSLSVLTVFFLWGKKRSTNFCPKRHGLSPWRSIKSGATCETSAFSQ